MHELQTVVTDVCCVCLSVGLSVSVSTCQSVSHGGHSVQPLPNHFGLLLWLYVCLSSGKYFCIILLL